MNKVILMGRLTRDPEVRYTQTNNTLVASFSLERITVYVHSAGFFSSGVALKSKTGIVCSPFCIFLHCHA